LPQREVTPQGKKKKTRRRKVVHKLSQSVRGAGCLLRHEGGAVRLRGARISRREGSGKTKGDATSWMRMKEHMERSSQIRSRPKLRLRQREACKKRMARRKKTHGPEEFLRRSKDRQEGLAGKDCRMTVSVQTKRGPALNRIKGSAAPARRGRVRLGTGTGMDGFAFSIGNQWKTIMEKSVVGEESNEARDESPRKDQQGSRRREGDECASGEW